MVIDEGTVRGPVVACVCEELSMWILEEFKRRLLSPHVPLFGIGL